MPYLLTQPKGFVALAWIALWERFGFYAVQTVWVLYLSKVFVLSDAQTYAIFSASGTLLYITPFIAGYVADRYLGCRYAVLFGLMLLALGYALLILPGHQVFYLAIALLIIGNGFFKACLATLLGTLYQSDDHRRDSGYTLFYMAMNIGAFLAPALSGFISQALGWSYVFGFASSGLVMAIVIALTTFHRYETDLKLHVKGKTVVLLFISTLLAAIGIAILIHIADLTNKILTSGMLLAIIWVLRIALRLAPKERSHMMVLITLTVFAALFWAIYNQTYSSLILFSDRLIDRNLAGYEIPTAMLQSLNPLLIIILTPLFILFWSLAAKRNILLSASAKFSVAFLTTALAYGVLLLGILCHHAVNSLSLAWLVGFYVLQTVAELLISPIGLSLVSQLAPVNYRNLMMGVWFLGNAGGYAIGNYLAQDTSMADRLVNRGDYSLIWLQYQHAFSLFAMLALVTAISLWCLKPILNRMANHDANTMLK